MTTEDMRFTLVRDMLLRDLPIEHAIQVADKAVEFVLYGKAEPDITAFFPLPNGDVVGVREG